VPHDVVRWGGEEFLIVAHGIDAAGLPRMAEEIRTLVAAQCFEIPGGEVLPVSVSIGLAPYPFGGHLGRLDWTRVIDLADRGLYEAKRNGRNTWVAISPGPGLDDRDLAGCSLAEAEQQGLVASARPARSAAPHAH
jgi:diguanylate cyclase (GGDEF)-like protein